MNQPKQVAIFGAGIAGLTAAHELIERGFKVEVYEMKMPSTLEQIDGVACGIGGMARTQWARVDRPAKSTPPMFSAQPLRLLPRETINFKSDTTYENPKKAAAAIDAVADALLGYFQKYKQPIKLVEVRGFCDELKAGPYGGPADQKDRVDWRRAAMVAEQFRKVVKEKFEEIKRPDDQPEVTTAGLGLGYPEDWTRPQSDRNYVSFHIIEDWIPGEHGFRFFPSFYRNLFDTMRRTPIADEHELAFSETPRSVWDNLLPTSFLGLGTSRSTSLFPYQRRPVTSLQQLFDQLHDYLKTTGVTLADNARFQAKLFKYMTSCAARRAAEYASQSWWDFLEADQYSKAFQLYLNETAESLVAMDAKHYDARTYGTISVQMLQDQVVAGLRTDATLNGPTSLAWFDHWRRYLEAQGVEFRRGVLTGFESYREQNQVKAVWPVVMLNPECGAEPVHAPDDGPDEEEPEVPTVVIRDFYVLALPANVVQGLVRDHPQLTGDDFDRIRQFPLGDPRQGETGGALAHLSGIQFYFNVDIRFLEGHFICPDAPWRLAAVSQPQFWVRKRGWWSGYRGVLSVDISNWTNAGSGGLSAWTCTRQEIATEVWKQVRAFVEQGGGGRRIAAEHIPDPIFYHLDEGMVLDEADRPQKNRMPYLACRPGEYERRPGTPGKYQLHHGLVLAGPFMQTHTRLTTMEAANESARHAVNAILDAVEFRGERCAIANPEQNEIEDLKFLIELDEQLHRLGLPHFVDILDLHELPRALLRPGPGA